MEEEKKMMVVRSGDQLRRKTIRVIETIGNFYSCRITSITCLFILIPALLVRYQGFRASLRILLVKNCRKKE